MEDINITLVSFSSLSCNFGMQKHPQLSMLKNMATHNCVVDATVTINTNFCYSIGINQ